MLRLKSFRFAWSFFIRFEQYTPDLHLHLASVIVGVNQWVHALRPGISLVVGSLSQQQSVILSRFIFCFQKCSFDTDFPPNWSEKLRVLRTSWGDDVGPKVGLIICTHPIETKLAFKTSANFVKSLQGRAIQFKLVHKFKALSNFVKLPYGRANLFLKTLCKST